MSSTIRLKSNCDFCGTEFIAKTTKTRYCSHNCNSKDYKARLRKEKINGVISSKNDVIQNTSLDTAKSKDFLTVKDVAILMGCSSRTIYRLIDSGTIKAVNLSQRLIRVNRLSLENVIPK